ncbi:MAG: CBS domain-containing protein [Chloroflexota bacterium]|nr:CBS domain-containing protein [Chloroflexota bacterium]
MPERLSVRDLLRQFGYERRGRIINRRIQNLLEKLDLQTEPDFTAAWLDGAISISLLAEGTDQPSVDTMPDPTLVVGSLPAAHVNEPPNDGLVSVAPDQPLLVATTLMQLHDFSQLPVMPGGSKRDVKGVISWQTIGVRRALELPSEYVRDCMDRAAEIVPIDMPLFEAIGRIARRGYALVQKGKGNNEITGIVTVSDLSEHFFDLAGPFFLLGQIEGNLRLLIHGKFRVNEMQEVADHRQGDGTITGSADLTFGEYCRLLENEQRWQKADIKASRKEFIAHLELAREIRNDVMHFDPDGLSEHDLRSLLQISQFVELLTHAIRS